MKTLWTILGRIVFWLCWPLIYVYVLNRSRVSVLIVHKNDVLLVKNWLGNGKWGLAGGGVKDGENSLTTARRELIEEVGLLTQPVNFVPLMSGIYTEAGLMMAQECFVVMVDSKFKPKITDPKIVKAKWFNKNKLKTKQLSSATRQALEAWFVVQ